MSVPRTYPRLVRLGLALMLAGPALASVKQMSVSNLPPPLKEKIAPLPFPAAIIATVNAQPARVVSVIFGNPCAEIDKQVKPLPPASRLMLLRGASFAPGFVAVTDQQANSTWSQEETPKTKDAAAATQIVSGSSLYTANLKADVAYGECYVVLLKFDRRFLDGTAAAPEFRFEFHDVGPLKAGVAKPVTIPMNLPAGDLRNIAYVPLVFCGGVEIHTNLDNFTGVLLRKAEEAGHALLVNNYVARNVGADEPLKPYAMPSPVFPAGLDTTKLPKTIDASFEVTAGGVVRNPVLKEKVPPAAAQAIERALSEWLFLPRMKAGHALQTKVEIPINIAGATGK